MAFLKSGFASRFEADPSSRTPGIKTDLVRHMGLRVPKPLKTSEVLGKLQPAEAKESSSKSLKTTAVVVVSDRCVKSVEAAPADYDRNTFSLALVCFFFSSTLILSESVNAASDSS